MIGVTQDDARSKAVVYKTDAARTRPTCSVLVAGRVGLIDGTLVPTVHWRHRTDLRSGKHRRYGMNVQLPVDLHGQLIGVSRAFSGSWHDVHCFREAGTTAGDLVTIRVDLC